MIRIQAESKPFSCDIQVKERNAVRMLVAIRDEFTRVHSNWLTATQGTNEYQQICKWKLKVKTQIV